MKSLLKKATKHKKLHWEHCPTLQSLEGTVLLEFLLLKLSIQGWNFFPSKAPSSQLHSEYGRPIHLQRYSGSLEDEVLWLWAELKKKKTIGSYTLNNLLNV